MEFLLHILLILLIAKLFGELFERAGMPAILGEVLTGVFLGMFLLSETEILTSFAELGAIFLLFTAGYKEVHLQDLKSSSLNALIATVFQIGTAFLFGFGLGLYFGFGLVESMFLAVAFSPTSIGVIVKTLIDMDYLSSRPGSMMLTSAIFDDIIGIFLLSVVVTMAQYNQFPSTVQLLLLAAKLLLFIVTMGVLGRYVFPAVFDYVHRMHVKESVFGTVVMIALFSAYLAELFQLHAVIGAFIGGVLISNIPIAKIEDVQSKVSGVAYGIFVPIFFAYIGLSVNFPALGEVGMFAFLVVTLALLGKLLGGFAGARTIGFDNHESLIFGAGMMPRAGVELVVISIGKNLGLITDEVFSAVVVMVAVSIFVSPVLLKVLIRKKYRHESDANPEITGPLEL